MAFATAALDMAVATVSRAVGGDGIVLWLVPQFALMGVGDGFALERLQSTSTSRSVSTSASLEPGAS